MGLDSVELVIRFEDTFGISISDEVAATLTTPRKVIDYVVTQVVTSDDHACLSQQAFYFLRSGFMKRLQVPRSAFRVDAPLRLLIPKQNRKRVWEELKAELGEQALPELTRPLWLVSLLTAVAVLIGAYAAYATLNVWAAAGISILCGFLLSVLSRPCRNSFPRGVSTVGELVEYLLSHSPEDFKRIRRVWTRAQVAETVRAVIVDQVGIKKFTDDSDFIDDMHID